MVQPSRRREYGVATTIIFLLDKPDGSGRQSDAICKIGDVKIIPDGGWSVNACCCFVNRGNHYSVDLCAGEMESDKITLIISDQTDPREWEDIIIYIETYKAQVKANE